MLYVLYFAIILQIFFFNCFPSTLSACWGGRPLAMGGAFTAVADSVDAVYWNPAGLAFSKGGFNTSIVTNWHDLNYDIYIAIGSPLKRGGFGLAYVYNKDYLVDLFFDTGEKLGWFAQDWQYFQGGYGTYLFKKWNLAIGVNGKMIYSLYEIDVDNEDKYGEDEKLSSDTLFDLDFGLHWAFGPYRGKHKMFSIGCLVQDILESEFKFNIEGEEITQKFCMNVRPGFSFRPDEMSIISVEIYDAGTAVYEKPQIRIGAERWFGGLALRAGGYHINEKSDKAYTGGLSWRKGKAEIAYTIIHWDESDENSHLITLNFWL